ncbi:MAG: hypothetical protein WCR36_10950 [Bacteroidaceae bacterium]
MKKIYSKPTIQPVQVNLESIIAASITVNSTKSIDGSSALSKKNMDDYIVWESYEGEDDNKNIFSSSH